MNTAALQKSWDDLDRRIAVLKKALLEDLAKVGPKGYIHGWIFVGAGTEGDSVSHPDLGTGKVTSSDAEGVHVKLDSGEEHDIRRGVSGAQLQKLPEPNAKNVTKWKKVSTPTLRKYLTQNIDNQDRSDITAALDSKTKPSTATDKGEKVKDFDAWGTQHNAGWRDKLTSDEKQATRSYSGSSFSMRANKNLRNGRELKDDDKTRAASLDSAIDKSTPLTSDTEVFRGLQGGVPKGWKKGSTITDNGFMSTTLDSDTAQRNFGRTILDLKAPRGAKAAYMTKEESPKFSNERELLFPRGTKFRITNITTRRTRDGSQVVMVHGEILPQ